VRRPSIPEIAGYLEYVRGLARLHSRPIEVRLQVYDDGSFQVYFTEPPNEPKDWLGYWGCGAVDQDSDVLEVARSLMEQVIEDHNASQ
jgi:hypothetical protein